MRFERKFPLPSSAENRLMAIVRTHPLGFRIEYPERQVNNIYMDTPDNRFLRETLDGVHQRSKYRIRWYGNDVSQLLSPRLEIKSKQGLLGEKMTQSLPDLKKLSYSGLLDYIRQNIRDVVALQPVLFNSYARSYYISGDRIFRLTIDRALRFASMDGSFDGKRFIEHNFEIIVEVKYDEKSEKE